MIATAPCPQCPTVPTPLSRLTDQLALVWHAVAKAAGQLVHAPSTNPPRQRRPAPLVWFNRRALDDINAPDWLYRELTLRQETSRLDTLRLRANYPHWL